jgi:diamine N-acetyltransferase
MDLAQSRFRAATLADALCLRVLGMQVFLDTYALRGIRNTLATEVLALFSDSSVCAALADSAQPITVAELDHHLIGFIHCKLHSGNALLAAQSPCEIARLYVQEPFTGCGLGAKLLGMAELAAAAQGASDVWLKAWEHNTRAIQFYARCGYRDVGATVYEFEGESHINRVLAKRLLP